MNIRSLLRSLIRIAVTVLILIGMIGWVLVRPQFFTPHEPKDSRLIDPGSLKSHVKVLSENFIPRDNEHVENLDKTAEYIYNQFSQFSEDVSYQTFNIDGKTYRNVLLKIGDSGLKKIIIGAHYDTYDELPGADDNASGVAGLLELGRLLSQHQSKNFQYELVAYTLEEPPYFATEYMGSYIHAESVSSEDIELMISLEMIGYFTDEKDSQSYPMPLMKLFYPSKGNFIAIVDSLFSTRASEVKRAFNQHTDLAAYSINAPSAIPGVDFSDHRNYWQFDIPAIMITDTSFYRYDHYHEETDSYEKLDYHSMAKVVFGLYNYILDIDNSD